MATKFLARTIIEGGRTGRSRYERRSSYKQENAHLRGYLHRVQVDPEYADETSPRPRTKVSREFDDRLGPARKWLHSRVGRPWDDVYSEMKRIFNTRTLPGRHIVYDHMLNDVEVVPDVARAWRRRGLYVDEDGILRMPEQKRSEASRSRSRKSVESVSKILEWMHYRKVGQRGSSWFWFEPTSLQWVPCEHAKYNYAKWWSKTKCPESWRPHCEMLGSTYKSKLTHHQTGGGSYRQTHRLTAEETIRWLRFRATWFGGADGDWSVTRTQIEMRFE